MKKILFALLLLIVVIVGYILYNTFTFPSKQITVAPASKISIPADAKEHLAKALTIRTISNENPEDFDSTAFYEFGQFVKNTYPLTDSLLELTNINEFSMIFKWEGSDTSLKPVILMGHLDVVPVATENLEKWYIDPFAGIIKDGVIWGRGAIDDKISVIGNLEAVELLLKEGVKPQRTIYLCYGHDEELGGLNGAVAIVKYLKEKDVEAEFVLDEGFAITQGLIPGTDKDIALIGTAEKGFVTLNLSIAIEGGHSSMPKEETAIDAISKAVARLKDNPFPAEITQPVQDFMSHIGPEMPFTQKMAFANPTIFRPMIISTLEKKPSGNALIRTTTAPTIINGGIKENVIPYEAHASINFRILPGTSIEDVKEHVINTIADDRIEVKEGSFNSEAPKSSSVNSFGYNTIHTTIKQIFPQVVVTPNLVIGATDSRYYYPLSSNVYRFTPFYLNSENISTFHGINERISVNDFENAIRFYAQLIRNSIELNHQ
ncbi:M20 family peptidase [Fulvivirga sp. 29W222]|uniref:M20 family peptidase n=1 Tax=Fulvivirga marina TaxID=2494733 RepID=A0A937KBF2_9BACT|nr:M20 family peptidase [Fulvivirga marina]MBL6445894.1 M20 family peptidase [Fulvivirga marina]